MLAQAGSLGNRAHARGLGVCMLAKTASADEMQRDLGIIPEAKPGGTLPMKRQHQH